MFTRINQLIIPFGYYMSELNLWVLILWIYFNILFIKSNKINSFRFDMILMLPMFIITEYIIIYLRTILLPIDDKSGQLGYAVLILIYVFAIIIITMILFIMLYGLYNKYIKSNYRKIFIICCLFPAISINLLYPIAREHEFIWSNKYYPSYVRETVLSAVKSNDARICDKLNYIYYSGNYRYRYNDKSMYFYKMWLVNRKYTYYFPRVAYNICYITVKAANNNNIDNCFMSIDDINTVESEKYVNTKELDKCEWMLIANKCTKYFNEMNIISDNKGLIKINNGVIKNNNYSNLRKIDNTSKLSMRKNFADATEIGRNPIGNEYITRTKETAVYVHGEIIEIEEVGYRNNLYDISMKMGRKIAKLRIYTVLNINGIEEIYFRLSDIDDNGILRDDYLNKIKIVKVWNRACNPNVFNSGIF